MRIDRSTSRRIRRLFTVVGAGIVISTAASSCGPSDATPAVDEERSAVTDPEQRAAIAQIRLNDARTRELEPKLEGLAEVAHLYWDTPSGPEAWRDLIFYLVHKKRDVRGAMKELESFRRQRPETMEFSVACEVLTGGLQKLAAEGEAVAKPLVSRAARYWIESLDRLLERPEHANDVDMLFALARAHVAAGEPAQADAAWARVATLDPPPPPFQRFEALMRRADLHRQLLGDPEGALELFRAAAALSPQLELEADENWGEYVRSAIRELENR